MKNKRGLFIVIYGTNNLGKTYQAERLVNWFKKHGQKAIYLKYPIYDLKPTGPRIHQILRSGQHQGLSEEQFQDLYTKNRFDFEPTLRKKIFSGINVIAEDYVGTGLAWGWSKGASLSYLEKSNSNLLKPDLAILFDGERFLQAREKNHLHESNDQLMKICRDKHLKLAKKYHWKKIKANQTKDEVFNDLIKIVKKYL